MSLKTYDRDYSDGNPPRPDPWPFVLVQGSPIPGEDDLHPGCFVRHHKDGGFGTVIAITDEQLTILWSQKPRDVFHIPGIRRVNQHLIARKIFEVEPMPMPSSAIFYQDYKYPNIEPKDE